MSGKAWIQMRPVRKKNNVYQNTKFTRVWKHFYHAYDAYSKLGEDQLRLRILVWLWSAMSWWQHLMQILSSSTANPWWRHQMETLSALLALCVGNSPATGEFPSQRPVTRSFDVFADLRLNKRLSKWSRRRWFETPSRSLWRHCNAVCSGKLPLRGIQIELDQHWVGAWIDSYIKIKLSMYLLIHALTSTAVWINRRWS